MRAYNIDINEKILNYELFKNMKEIRFNGFLNYIAYKKL